MTLWLHFLEWRLGLVVARWSRSTKLLYTSGPLITGMGDHLRAGKPPRLVTSHWGQLSLLPSAGRKMSTSQKCSDAVGLRSKGRHCLLVRSIVMSASVCLSVCLSRRISPEPHARSVPIFVRVAYGRGSVFLRHIDDRPHRLSLGRGDYSASAQRGRSVICDCIVSLVDKRVDGRNRIYLTIALCKCGVVLSIFGEADFVSNVQKFNLGPSYFRWNDLSRRYRVDCLFYHSQQPMSNVFKLHASVFT